MTAITDGRFARSAATLDRLIDAWISVFATGKRPTREDVLSVSGVSRASISRLTSMPELAVLGTERLLANQPCPVTDINGLDAHLHDRAEELRAQADVLICVTDDPSILGRIEAIVDDLRRCNAVRQRWIGQGR
jgi:hypothetical protein